jgi:hypothetical protein
MTRDDIIRMAREAGLIKDWMVLRNEESDALARFASLIAAAEREACARMAEAFHQHGYDFTGDLELHEAIRARSQT